MNHFGNSPVVINFRLASGAMRLLFFTKSLHIGEKLRKYHHHHHR